MKRKRVALIGAGIMSATIGILLKELNPEFQIDIYERLDDVAKESSDAWNNAGTGHSAFCELNYTPEINGEIDITKAIKIATQFEMSKAFWAYLVNQNYFAKPELFINNIPHISFVWGEENIDFLKKRFEKMKLHPLFKDMQFSTDRNELTNWMPLVMQHRNNDKQVAATKMDIGTDVNFGNLTRTLFSHLIKQPNVNLYLQHEVRDLERIEDDSPTDEGDNWKLKIKNLQEDTKFYVESDFVFLGAGGGALPLLEKSDIEEGEGYGGFPVSGQWLVCKNEDIIQQHNAKVYGKASVGSPPMSVPHLDTRIINSKKELLFGPFAGFSTKFLKEGSYFDLPLSIELDNIIPMLSAGWHNMELTKYLILQISMSHEEKIEALREYLPEAKSEDWEIEIAGQRVQVIKKDEELGGILQFGTEIVTSSDGSIAALLGASPGASTSVKAMIDVIKKCFPEEMETPQWKTKLNEMVPMFGYSLSDAELIEHRHLNNHILRLDD